ncbi:MAG: hypothetical protein AAFX94_11750 [Myxococcota bacterium]
MKWTLAFFSLVAAKAYAGERTLEKHSVDSESQDAIPAAPWELAILARPVGATADGLPVPGRDEFIVEASLFKVERVLAGELAEAEIEVTDASTPSRLERYRGGGPESEVETALSRLPWRKPVIVFARRVELAGSNHWVAVATRPASGLTTVLATLWERSGFVTRRMRWVGSLAQSEQKPARAAILGRLERMGYKNVRVEIGESEVLFGFAHTSAAKKPPSSAGLGMLYEPLGRIGFSIKSQGTPEGSTGLLGTLGTSAGGISDAFGGLGADPQSQNEATCRGRLSERLPPGAQWVVGVVSTTPTRSGADPDFLLDAWPVRGTSMSNVHIETARVPSSGQRKTVRLTLTAEGLSELRALARANMNGTLALTLDGRLLKFLEIRGAPKGKDLDFYAPPMSAKQLAFYLDVLAQVPPLPRRLVRPKENYRTWYNSLPKPCEALISR